MEMARWLSYWCYRCSQFHSTMGIICQRAIILHLGAAVLHTFLYWFLGPILIAIGQSESIAEQGQIFAFTHNIVNPLSYMYVGVFFVHVLLTWLVVYVLDYGLIRAALTLSFSWWLLVIVNGLYILLSPNCKETWTSFSWKALWGIWPYFRLTVTFVIWYNQGLVLISGLLTNPIISLDSISIFMNYLMNWDLQFMLGLSAAASNELGARHPRVAKLYVFVVSGTSLLISIVFSAIILILKVELSKLFMSDFEVIEAVTNLTPLLAISVFLNGIQPILLVFFFCFFFYVKFVWFPSVAIGSGWLAMVAYVNLATYYVIGLPIGCVLPNIFLRLETRSENKYFAVHIKKKE
ncbi:hypothetical protein UlMin_040073 [Ulmus minor]